MVKKRKILKIAFSVVTIACVIMSMAMPAMAYVWNDDDVNAFALLKGTCDLRLVDLPDDISGSMHAQFDLGGRLPFFDVTGVNDSVFVFDLYSALDDSWHFHADNKLARYKKNLSVLPSGTSSATYAFDSYRYNISTFLYDVDSGVNERVYFDLAEFSFEPYYFNSLPSMAVLKELFTLRLTIPCKVTTFLKYSWIDTGGKLITKQAQGDWVNVGNSNVWAGSAIPPSLESVLEEDMKNVAGKGFLIEQFNVKITPLAGADFRATGLSFQMLVEQFKSGTPNWYHEDSMSEWNDAIRGLVGSGSAIGGYPDVGDDTFMTFFASAVGSFFDVELFPGFSLGGVLGVVVTVAVMLIILKYFGGG